MRFVLWQLRLCPLHVQRPALGQEQLQALDVVFRCVVHACQQRENSAHPPEGDRDVRISATTFASQTAAGQLHEK